MAKLVDMTGPSGEPATVVVFLFAGLMMLNMSQLRAAFGLDVSKSTTFNQMAAYKRDHPSDLPDDVYATKQQRDFCKANDIPGTARSKKLKLVNLDDLIGFCETYEAAWGFLLPQLRLLNVAGPPASVTAATLTLSPEHLQASHLATAPIQLQESMDRPITYTAAELAGQYGLHIVRPRWAIPQLQDFLTFQTAAFQFQREGQAVSDTTARKLASGIGSFIGFCVTFRGVISPPTLLVRCHFAQLFKGGRVRYNGGRV